MFFLRHCFLSELCQKIHLCPLHSKRTRTLKRLCWGRGALDVALPPFVQRFITVETRGSINPLEEAENLASSGRGASSSLPRLPQSQSTQPAQPAQSHDDSISALLPILVSLQQTQQQILELFVCQVNRPSPYADCCASQ